MSDRALFQPDVSAYDCILQRAGKQNMKCRWPIDAHRAYPLLLGPRYAVFFIFLPAKHETIVFLTVTATMGHRPSLTHIHTHTHTHTHTLIDTYKQTHTHICTHAHTCRGPQWREFVVNLYSYIPWAPPSPPPQGGGEVGVREQEGIPEEEGVRGGSCKEHIESELYSYRLYALPGNPIVALSSNLISWQISTHAHTHWHLTHPHTHHKVDPLERYVIRNFLLLLQTFTLCLKD